MDASQYKDYVLVLLFVKYISDKYDGVPYAPITIPEGASFKDMVKLKGKATIGDDINKKILGPIAQANKLSEMPDFNNADKLGSGKDMVNRLTNLVAIFENPLLDFSKNRAEGDDILGDAYEYLMRHFATESGKSKGQFYTPAEVSRIIAKTIGIASSSISNPTVYDPTCGSGSLLLKVADETEKKVALYGQELDSATASLAKMNMILHGHPGADIRRENTLAAPLFLEETNRLKTFDFVVANPPFSFKSWTNGLMDEKNIQDSYGRFQDFGIPPAKNGDYAFLLHILKSLKSKGKGACILPHGVLFRGNAEGEIRMNLIRRGYIKGIIGLPANLFYGTGIPACIILLDKENAEHRKGIFMIEASRGFMKDGNKNRLRAQDIHRIVDVFNKQTQIPRYSRMVSLSEIEKNDFNLNIPRYIDSQETEDIQDIAAHLQGDIPQEDIESLENYFCVYPTLKTMLFGKSKREGYSTLLIPQEQIKETIFSHPEFQEYAKTMESTFSLWKERTVLLLKNLSMGCKPKELIHKISEDILSAFGKTSLLDQYDIYQHLMTYWSETIQDDVYAVASLGWKAELEPIEGKKGEWECDLLPKRFLVHRYFSAEKKAIEELETKRDGISQELDELIEEHSGEEGYFASLDKLNKATASKRLKEIQGNSEDASEQKALESYLKLSDKVSEANKRIKIMEKSLESKVLAQYKNLTETEIKDLVVDDKWMTSLYEAVKGEMDRISHRLTQRIKELAERYAVTLPELERKGKELEEKVEGHLRKMGFLW